ncbi:MAG: OmpA family protein [Pseudomonadales bacterium]|nr:OmpA family protein [Pseudomonadales bacterium]
MRITRLAVTALCLALGTTACTTINPYTGETQTSKAVKYGAGAGVVCALLGATRNSTSARNAGVGCGLLGAGIGAYMDAQEAELRQQMQGTGVEVQRNGDQLNLIMPGNITFNTNEFTIRPEFYAVLDSVGETLYKFQDTRLIVSGHTDSTGSADYNYNLSNRRASSVTNYLAIHGINQGRMIAQGMGPSQPIASNSTDAGRAQNRRVEMQIIAAPSN